MHLALAGNSRLTPPPAHSACSLVSMRKSTSGERRANSRAVQVLPVPGMPPITIGMDFRSAIIQSELERQHTGADSGRFPARISGIGASVSVSGWQRMDVRILETQPGPARSSQEWKPCVLSTQNQRVASKLKRAADALEQWLLVAAYRPPLRCPQQRRKRPIVEFARYKTLITRNASTTPAIYPTFLRPLRL